MKKATYLCLVLLGGALAAGCSPTDTSDPLVRQPAGAGQAGMGTTGGGAGPVVVAGATGTASGEAGTTTAPITMAGAGATTTPSAGAPASTGGTGNDAAGAASGGASTVPIPAVIPTKVLFWGTCPACYEGASFVAITESFEDAGATFENLATLPGSLTDYRIVLVGVPQSGFTAVEQQALIGFHDAGGGLILMGERSVHPPNVVANDAINELLAALGYAAEMSIGDFDTDGTATTINGASPLMDGVTAVEGNSRAALVATPAATLASDSAGNVTLAATGNVLLSGDSNFALTGGTLVFAVTGNRRVFINAWNHLPSYLP